MDVMMRAWMGALPSGPCGSTLMGWRADHPDECHGRARNLDPQITAFLRKPLDLDQLLALVSRLLTRS
jgi:hypothetical protein